MISKSTITQTILAGMITGDSGHSASEAKASIDHSQGNHRDRNAGRKRPVTKKRDGACPHLGGMDGIGDCECYCGATFEDWSGI
jgi:hypothetical protein